jgi:hypothetical protein
MMCMAIRSRSTAYDTEDAAERAIAQVVIERMRLYLRGRIDFEEAMHLREYSEEARVSVTAVTGGG